MFFGSGGDDGSPASAGEGTGLEGGDPVGDHVVEFVNFDGSTLLDSFREERDREEEIFLLLPAKGPASAVIVVHHHPMKVQVLGHDIAEGEAQGLLFEDVFPLDGLAVEEALDDFEVANFSASEGGAEMTPRERLGEFALTT